MKTKYLWVVTACAVFSGSHAASSSEVPGTTFMPDSRAAAMSELWPDATAHGWTMPVAIDAATIDTKKIKLLSMMEIKVLNTIPEVLPSIPVSEIVLVTDSKSGTFSAAIQPQLTKTAPSAENRLFAMSIGLTPSVPEPETWAILLAGLGLIGLQLRHRHGSKIDIH